MIGILVKALWVTLLAYILFIISRLIYRKYFKKDAEAFFYFKGLAIDETKQEAELSILAPVDDFEMDIIIWEQEKELYTKNARLTAGINTISIPVIASSNALLIMRSAKQKVERNFVHAEL